MAACGKQKTTNHDYLVVLPGDDAEEMNSRDQCKKFKPRAKVPKQRNKADLNIEYSYAYTGPRWAKRSPEKKTTGDGTDEERMVVGLKWTGYPNGSEEGQRDRRLQRTKGPNAKGNEGGYIDMGSYGAKGQSASCAEGGYIDMGSKRTKKKARKHTEAKYVDMGSHGAIGQNTDCTQEEYVDMGSNGAKGQSAEDIEKEYDDVESYGIKGRSAGCVEEGYVDMGSEGARDSNEKKMGNAPTDAQDICAEPLMNGEAGDADTSDADVEGFMEDLSTSEPSVTQDSPDSPEPSCIVKQSGTHHDGGAEESNQYVPLNTQETPDDVRRGVSEHEYSSLSFKKRKKDKARRGSEECWWCW